MKRYFALVLAVLLAALGGARADGPNDQYVAIYSLIETADAFGQGQASQALAKYLEAQTALQKFQKNYPDWNAEVVNFRSNYLATKIAALTPKPPGTESAKPAPAPGDYEGRLAALNEQVRELQADKVLLEAKLKEALAALPAAFDPRELAKAEEQIKSLQKERDLLVASMAQAKAQPAPETATAAPTNPKEAKQIKQLERERDELKKQLDAAKKVLASRKGKSGANQNVELLEQVFSLRAQLQALDAKAVPYAPEELALLQTPEQKPAAASKTRKTFRELPAGTAALVTQAQRYFSEKRYDKAEEIYLQIVREDDKNVAALADLALIQLLLNKQEQSERHLKQALALAPEDAYSLSVLGHLKYQQQKYDDALEALARAAQIDPFSAEIQNFLGITLSQKGQHGPAEAALRKAVLLQPNYADAHHNLAVFYATAQPPSMELARWHYQKAIANGHACNPDLEKTLGLRPSK